MLPTQSAPALYCPTRHHSSSGVSYSRGCGPPVLPPGQDQVTGTRLRQFVGTVGWLGQTGRLIPPGPAGVHLHPGLDIGVITDMCRWLLQAPGIAEGQPLPGGTGVARYAPSCSTTWADPLQFLP